jgi:hypothetical protein
MVINRKTILIHFMPLLLLLTDACMAQGIKLGSGAYFTTTGAATIQITDGGFVNNGTYIKGLETITLSGTSAQAISGSSSTDIYNLSITNTGGITSQIGLLTVHDLTIASGSRFTIDTSASVTVSNALTNNESASGLVINSARTSTGSLIQSSSAVFATFQRFMTKGKWHIISIPVSGQTISNFVQNVTNSIGFNSTTSEYGMMPYNPTNNTWAAFFTSGTAGNYNIGEGYMVRRKNSGLDGVVAATGTLQSGTINVTGLIAGKWNCIGNPYTSTIGAKSTAGTTANFLDANASNLEPTHAAIYVWNEQPSYTGPTRSDYNVISNSGYIPVLSKDYLQVGQGFLVKMAGGATAVNFTSAMQSHQVTETYLKKSTRSWPGFELVASTSDFSINTIVAFNEKMAIGLDPTYDAGVLKGNPNLAIFTRLVSDNGIDFAIQCLPLDGLDTFIIAVGIDYPSGGDISFSARTDLIPYGSSVILEDRVTGIFTDLGKSNAVYTVNLPPSSFGTGRFYLHTGDGQANNIPALNKPLKVYSFGKKIYINGELTPGSLISLYSTQGVLIRTYSLSNSISRQLDAEGISDGVYILIITDQKKNNTFKLFL